MGTKETRTDDRVAIRSSASFDIRDVKGYHRALVLQLYPDISEGLTYILYQVFHHRHFFSYILIAVHFAKHEPPFPSAIFTYLAPRRPLL
jgi:hypothetical protein